MPRRPHLAATILVCGLLALLFAFMSYRAVLTKSATLDEPLHVASAYAATYLHDFRLDPENPPLWKYWSMLFVRSSGLKFDPNNAEWLGGTQSGNGQMFSTEVLYQTPGNDGIEITNRVRAAMVILGAATMLIAAAWAFRLAGAAAAIVTSVLFAFDPTLLAHSAIVKNDLAMTLLFLLLAISVSQALARLTILNALSIALVCAASVNVKFSGLQFPVIVAVLLLIRALSSRPWVFMGRSIVSRWQRLITVMALGLLILAISWVTIWTCYDFRYSVAPDVNTQMDLPAIASGIVDRALASRLGREPTTRESDQGKQPLSVRAILELDRRRLLPQSWSAGFLGVLLAMAQHQNYLLGTIKEGGWWYYFPLAIIFKTPLATLVACAGAAVVAVALSRRQRAVDRPAEEHASQTACCCILVMVAMYLAFGMSQAINHGVRHMLPVAPILFVLVGTTAARACAIWPKPIALTAAILGLALAAESLTAYPNYIAYFNVAAGSTRGGFRLLGDSNLDWGQDLPQLAAWQHDHPHERLYLCYYGAADPAAYGIRYINLPGGFFAGPPVGEISEPGVIAISTTRLQGLYMFPQLRTAYARMRSWKVRDVLGGTIYLFDYPQPASTSK